MTIKNPRQVKKPWQSIVVAVVFVFLTLGSAAGYLIWYDLDLYTRLQTQTFTEQVGTVNNPGIGRSITWGPTFYPADYHEPGKVTPTIPSWVRGSLVCIYPDLGPFSAGANGVRDYDLDAKFFTDLRAMLATCRANGSMVALRFRYDENGKGNYEPSTFAQVLAHIQALQDDGVLTDFADTIAFIESGFVGKWGEQHGGKYVSVAEKAQILDALLKAVPEPIPVTVRTPDTFAYWAGVARRDLGKVAITKPNAYRVGLYNDGYLGSDSDLGTYANRAQETGWLNQQTQSYFGGEFSGNWGYAQQFDTYLPENALPEMYRTHLSYLNNGYMFDYYRNVTFDARYAIAGVDNQAYYGQTVAQFILDHLGYRWVLQRAQITGQVLPGGRLQVAFDVVNKGFANLHQTANCAIWLTNGTQTIKLPLNVDPRLWLSQGQYHVNASWELPRELPTGVWQVYFRADIAGRPIACANNNVYDANYGANRLGTFYLLNKHNLSLFKE